MLVFNRTQNFGKGFGLTKEILNQPRHNFVVSAAVFPNAINGLSSISPRLMPLLTQIFS
jgi:hypothetical protein